MTDDLTKSVDVVDEDRRKYHDETACRIIEEYEGYMGELIAKQLGYEYGNGYRAGFNQLQDVCRTLAFEVAALRAHEQASIEDVVDDENAVVSLKMSARVRTNLNDVAAAFVKEAERTYLVTKEVQNGLGL